MNEAKLIKARYLDYIMSSLDELDVQFTDLLEEEELDTAERVLIEHIAAEVGSISETIQTLLANKYTNEYRIIQDEFYKFLSGLTQGFEER